MFELDTQMAMDKNLFVLSNVLDIRLKVDFKGDYFYVKVIDKIILKGKWKKYKNDYDSQKEFIKNVLKKLFKNVEVDEYLENYHYVTRINNIKTVLYCDKINKENYPY